MSHVIRLGFEPKTHSLEGCCSIQLSYRTGLVSRSGRLSCGLLPEKSRRKYSIYYCKVKYILSKLYHGSLPEQYFRSMQMSAGHLRLFCFLLLIIFAGFELNDVNLMK